MLSSEQVLKLINIGHFIPAGYIDDSTGFQPANLYVSAEDLVNAGIPKEELSPQILYHGRSITRFISKAGYGLSIDIVNDLIDSDSTLELVKR